MVSEIKAVSVSQINAYIKKLIDSNGVLSNFWISGEISNYKRHYSGHLYITLKDEKSVLKAVMFKGNTTTLNFEPKDGMQVLARGRLSVYDAGGTYQFYIEEMIQSGMGELQLKFEQLKNKLMQEGLFEQSNKKEIPKIPEKIGVCTATTGAAVRDIINVISRRFPYSQIIIFPTIVQGDFAADSIVSAIEWFNKNNGADVLIVGRGGGSIEDLWAFNEEKVAYAIFKSKIPIISAVGHETDFTIADFVADLRAPTPSAAAELVVPDKTELYYNIDTSVNRLTQIINERISFLRLKVDTLTPVSPEDILKENKLKLDLLLKNLESAYNVKYTQCNNLFLGLVAKLDALSPLSVMTRGYSVVLNSEGAAYNSASQFTVGDEFVLKMWDGSKKCLVTENLQEGDVK